MFFNDAMMGPAWASCADIGERHAGTLSGAMNMTGAFLGAAGMTLAGWWLESGTIPSDVQRVRMQLCPGGALLVCGRCHEAARAAAADQPMKTRGPGL